MITPTLILLTAFSQVPSPSLGSPSAQPSDTKAVAAQPAPPQTPEVQALQLASSKVADLRSSLKTPGLSLQKKNKLKKALMHAEARAREARAAAINQAVRMQEAAYVEKMLPVWLEQQRLNAQFSIEQAKARALQQMANTAERKRIDDLYINYQRNQILADEARILNSSR